MKSILTAFARNTVFANISLVMVLLAGLISMFVLIRENFPEFSLDMIVISVPYPGADPEEVEEGISRKIEEAIEGIEGIKQYTTESNENIGTAMIEVKETYEAADVLDEVKREVDAISTFPVDAEQPVIKEITLKDPVITLYLTGDMGERRLKEWSEQIKDELQALENVSQVGIFGNREYEIGIELSETRLREYGLSLEMVADAVRRSNLNLAGGTLRTKGEEIRVRTMGRKYTGEELSEIVVLARPNGEIITLDRLANIRDDFVEDPISATINGQTSVIVEVYKTKEEDAIAISKSVQAYVDRKKDTLPGQTQIKILYDNTDMLRSRINLLTKNGVIGLAIVFFLLWLFLNTRLSFWSGMGIPISIAGALAILYFIGGTINMITLFGFIMVLGVVVDDAIVVGESIYVHRKRGKHPLQAAVDGVSEVGMPVVAAVLTSIVAFLPLYYIGGVMGKFIAEMPTVVIACLAVSLFECLLMLPAHLSHLPDLNAANGESGRVKRSIDKIHRTTTVGMEWVVRKMYRPLLRKAMAWRYVSFCVAISALLATTGLVAGGIIKFEVFPKADGFVATGRVEFPEGTPIEITREGVHQVEKALLRISEQMQTKSGESMLVDRLALVGSDLDPHTPVSGAHVGAVRAILLPSERRGIHSEEIMVEWEKAVGRLSGVKSLTFAGLAMGPPGDPIEVWLQGYDMKAIIAAAKRLEERLEQFDGVNQIRSDFSPGKNEMRLSLKPEARALGVTVEDLARQVYAGYYGREALRLQRGRDDIRVKVRYAADERRNLTDLERIRIRTANGNRVPLLSVADVQFAPGYAKITRTDGLRRVVVSAGVDSNRANANEIIGELATDYFPLLSEQFPELKVSIQGEKKKMRESFSTLQVGFPLAVFGIFIIVATIFRSYVQPFVILITIPFGIIGAVWGHFIMGLDLAMMSIFGMVALTGVVVNDAIVLIERINENIAEGMPFFKALEVGGSRRFRAIILTSLSTIGGLAPIIMETDFQARFLIPMALSLAAGVAFATVLTLVLIPSLLVILNDLRCLLHYVLKRRWPSRETVEPAAQRYLTPQPTQTETDYPAVQRI